MWNVKHGLWTQDAHYNLKINFALAAVEMILAFLPFGFIAFRSATLTTMEIGVIIAALWGGVSGGMLSGFIFGICSMWQAGIAGVHSKDLLFSPVRSGNALGSILLAVGTRVMFGLIAGLVFLLIFRFLKKGRLIASLISGIFLKHIHAMLVYHCMSIFFHPEGVSVSKVFKNMFTPVQLMESCYIAATFLAAYAVYHHWLSKNYYQEYAECGSVGKKHVPLYIISGLIFITAVLLMLMHMVVRLDTLFDVAHISLENMDTMKMMHIVLQFMCAFGSLTYLLINIMNHYRTLDESRYYQAENEKQKISSQLSKERNLGLSLAYEAEHDALTGMLNRSAFNKIKGSDQLTGKPVGFMLADIDHFKEVNDTYGHNIGDKVLANTANRLKEAFRAEDLIFRMGGDEFAVLLPYYKKEDGYLITEKINELNQKLQQPVSGMPVITVSAGFDFSADGYRDQLLINADKALYSVKRNSHSGCRAYSEENALIADSKNPR